MATILAIHAHPDDIEILAGGTVAMLAAGGNRVVAVSMTPGDCGSHHHSPEEIAAIRRREAANAARLAGAEYRCAEFRDLAIFNDDSSRRRVVEILRQVRADIVLTSAPIDYMCDHEATSMLVRDGCFAAPAPNYRTNASDPAPAIPAIPHLYFMDSVAGVDRENRRQAPDFFVNVGPYFATKRAMLAEHKSQREWLREHHGMDNYLITMEQWTRANGTESGVEFAEGFRQYKGHPYPESPLLQQLLGTAVLPANR
jgi:N-acetylglucosamine malate deacetylase 1